MALENELREKEQENRLHAMKVKDMMRKLNSDSRQGTVMKEAKELNRMISRGSKNSRMGKRNTVTNNLEPDHANRAKSIDPFPYPVKKGIERKVNL